MNEYYNNGAPSTPYNQTYSQNDKDIINDSNYAINKESLMDFSVNPNNNIIKQTNSAKFMRLNQETATNSRYSENFTNHQDYINSYPNIQNIIDVNKELNVYPNASLTVNLNYMTNTEPNSMHNTNSSFFNESSRFINAYDRYPVGSPSTNGFLEQNGDFYLARNKPTQNSYSLYSVNSSGSLSSSSPSSSSLSSSSGLQQKDSPLGFNYSPNSFSNLQQVQASYPNQHIADSSVMPPSRNNPVYEAYSGSNELNSNKYPQPNRYTFNDTLSKLSDLNNNINNGYTQRCGNVKTEQLVLYNNSSNNSENGASKTAKSNPKLNISIDGDFKQNVSKIISENDADSNYDDSDCESNKSSHVYPWMKRINGNFFF